MKMGFTEQQKDAASEEVDLDLFPDQIFSQRQCSAVGIFDMPLPSLCVILLRAYLDRQTNHSLFSARVVPELSVSSGGTLINAEGNTSEKGTFGAASPWCDYSGTRNDLTEGIAILQNPANRWYPGKWFTRDYGFFSPTPMFWLEGDKLNLAKGEKLILEYRVVVHAGDSKTANVAGLFSQYKQTAK